MFEMAYVERENEILKIIQGMVDAELEFIVVGGYAVSSLARHRYSVDSDIVIPKEQLNDFEKFLSKQEYKKHVETWGFNEYYAGRFVSYEKRVLDLPVTFDFLVNSLVCRSTGASWSYEYIQEHSIEANIPGIETSVRCRIPEKELLIAFKIHSGRRADVRDVIMLVEDADTEKVLTHIKRGDIEELKNQLTKANDALEDKNLNNSLKGVFTLTVDVEKQITNSKKFIQAIRSRI